MSNRWNQALHNQINKKKSELEKREEIKHETVLKKEKLDEIEEKIKDTPLLNSEEEFEEFERKIEAVNTEEEV